MIFALLLLGAIPELQQARDRFSTGNYAQAVALLENLLAQENVAASERRDALILLGAANFGLGLNDAARRKFRDALALDPKVRPIELAPKIVRLFDAVRSELYPMPTVARARELVTEEGGERFLVRWHVTVSGGTSPQRPSGPPLELCTERCVPMVLKDGEASAVIDLGELTRATVTWSVRLADTGEVALGPEKELLSRARAAPVQVTPVLTAASAPASVAVAAQPPPPAAQPRAEKRKVYEQWWFWVPIAAVVAGGVVTGAILGSRPTSGPATIGWTIGE